MKGNVSCDCLVEVGKFSSVVVFCGCDAMWVDLLNRTYSSDWQKQGSVSAGCVNSHSHDVFVWPLVDTFNLSACWALQSCEGPFVSVGFLWTMQIMWATVHDGWSVLCCNFCQIQTVLPPKNGCMRLLCKQLITTHMVWKRVFQDTSVEPLESVQFKKNQKNPTIKHVICQTLLNSV